MMISKVWIVFIFIVVQARRNDCFISKSSIAVRKAHTKCCSSKYQISVDLHPSRNCLYVRLSMNDSSNEPDNSFDEIKKDETEGISSNLPKFHSFGLTSRSQASQRKALGKGKEATVYLCTNCGAESVQWMGKCPTCEEWNTVQPFRAPRETKDRSMQLPLQPPEEFHFDSTIGDFDIFGVDPARIKEELHLERSYSPSIGDGSVIPWITSASRPIPSTQILEHDLEERVQLQIGELARTLGGGGVVKGSLVLVGGDPGVGKSTLLLQMAGDLSLNNKTVVYCSGEESKTQVASRARRLGVLSPNLLLLSDTHVDAIVQQVAYGDTRPSVLIIDSIQTMKAEGIKSQAGSATQVKECGLHFLQLAKQCGIAVFLVGHVTKTGDFAGPKVLEHMVDTVLYLEGEKYSTYRLLRCVKNRYGSSNEIGVFEMSSKGMQEVPNPSVLFLSQNNEENGTRSDGSSVAVVLEGSRPILVEVQSLVSPTKQSPPRRAFEGVSFQRGLLLLAILERRFGYSLSQKEVYINVVGGLKIQETASDLSVMASIVSSATSTPVRPRTTFIGEVGLGGEVRVVPQIERRVFEAAKFGFNRIIIPMGSKVEGLTKIKHNLFRSKVVDDFAPDGQVEIICCENVKIALRDGLTNLC